jgi:hypothetical protein
VALCTGIIAQLTGKTFEGAYRTILGETEAYKILDPIWIERVPDLARPMEERNLYYKVVEFKWGMRVLSVELWYGILGNEETAASWPVHARIRISDRFSKYENWIHFGKTDFERIGDEWILRGGKSLWIPQHYSGNTPGSFCLLGVDDGMEMPVQEARNFLNDVLNIVK